MTITNHIILINISKNVYKYFITIHICICKICILDSEQSQKYYWLYSDVCFSLNIIFCYLDVYTISTRFLTIRNCFRKEFFPRGTSFEFCFSFLINLLKQSFELKNTQKTVSFRLLQNQSFCLTVKILHVNKN